LSLSFSHRNSSRTQRKQQESLCYALSMNEMINEKQLPELRTELGCQILTASDQEYEAARRVWNGMIDRKPSMIVRPLSIADVMQTVRLVREQQLPVSVRGAGHSVSGKSVADGAVMIDLSRMKGIEINPGKRSVVVQGGVTWGELDRETESYGLATTGGVISSTGVAGLTLGGGIGWLMGQRGLSCDNLISADLVNADGRHMSVSASGNEDLFWAIRGGGGNFGIVTALEFRLHSLESVEGGILLYPRSAAVDLLLRYRDVTLTAPDELTAYAALMTGHGSPLAAIAFCHCGARTQAVGASRQFFLTHAPIADMTGEKKYSEVQSMLDFTAPAGLHYYFKCPFLRNLTDDAIRTIVECSESAPTEQTQVVIEHMHGAASRIPATDTAFGLRRVHYSINIVPAWSDPAHAGKCIAWAQGFSARLESLGASDAYVNYLGDEGTAAVQASYGVNYERLSQLKRKYDPDNFFRSNQNIPPAN
jgi:FAD/FMN-containing dehydrogenase